MSAEPRAIVEDADGVGHSYPGGTGLNYDSHGFLVVVTGTGENPEPVAVWAPGSWRHADLVKPDSPTDQQEVPFP